MKDVIYGQLRLADLDSDGRDDVVVTGSGLVDGEFDRSERLPEDLHVHRPGEPAVVGDRRLRR